MKKIKIELIIIFTFFLFLQLFFLPYLFAQTTDNIIGGAGPVEEAKDSYFIRSNSFKMEMSLSETIEETVKKYNYFSYLFTVEDVIFFGYETDTQIALFDSTGQLIWNNNGVSLNKGEHAHVTVNQGVYTAASTKYFSVLSGDAISRYVVGYYARDQFGRGTSTEFYTWAPQLFGHCSFIVFGYEDNTQVVIEDTDSKAIIANITLNKGEHWRSENLNRQWIHAKANKPISVLTAYDQGYYVPSANGNWSGTEFYTYVGDVQNWAQDLTIISYKDGTEVTIKDSDTDFTLWSGILDGGQAHVESFSSGADKFFTILSSEAVTVSVLPWISWTSSYHQGAYIPGASGSLIDTDLIGSTLTDGYLYILAYEDDTRVNIYDSRTGKFINDYLLNDGDYIQANPGNGLWRIISEKPVSAYSGYGQWNADFAPVKHQFLSTIPPEGAYPISDGELPQVLPIPEVSTSGSLLIAVLDQTSNEIFYTNSMDHFDPDKDTIIILHGWNPGQNQDLPDWLNNMSLFLKMDGRANVLVWDWLGPAGKSPIEPPEIGVMVQQGDYLANAMMEKLPLLSYGKKLHFISHSSGSRVTLAAIDKLDSRGISVDHFTALDAYLFDATKFAKKILNPSDIYGLKSNEWLEFIDSVFEFYPISKTDFFDNYWAVVGSMSYVAELGFSVFSIFQGVNPLIVDELYCLYQPILKHQVTDELREKYFLHGFIDSFHKPPVNWYIASMADQLQIKNLESTYHNEHQYGFYWSSIFTNTNERPQKMDIDLLLGCENYYDLKGTPNLIKDVVLIINEGVEYTEEQLNRLKDKVIEIGTTIIVKSIDGLSDASGWIVDKADGLYHYVENKFSGWLWVVTKSPVAFSKEDYFIPIDGNWFGFSFEILQADQGDSIEVFINGQPVYYKTIEEFAGKGIVFSDLINVSNWSGSFVDLTFRINSFDGLPLVLKIHDLVFADLELNIPDFASTPPVADAGSNQTISAMNDCQAIATLDGSASYDPENALLFYNWTWDGGSATGVNPTIQLPLGTHTITLVVNDGEIDSHPDTVEITVVDENPPEISLSVSPDTLWPPNHKMVAITPTISVSDNCDPAPLAKLLSITSNERDNAEGDGNTTDDIQIKENGQIYLRAERTGTGSGRIYTITYEAVDNSGNSSTAAAIVTVPLNQSKKR